MVQSKKSDAPLELSGESAREYRHVVEHSEDQVAVVDKEYVFRLVNAAFLDGRGLERRDVVGRPVREIVGSGVYEDLVRPNLERCFQGAMVEYEMEYVHPQQGPRLFLVRSTPVSGEEGTVDRVVSVIKDITGWRRTHKELQEKSLWLASTFEALEDAVFLTSPLREIVDINPAAERIFGYTKKELDALTTQVLHVDEEHFREFGQVIARAFELGETARFDFQARRKNGEIFPTEHTVSLLRHEDGSPLGILSVVRDITHRKQAMADLQDSEERFRLLVENIDDVFWLTRAGHPDQVRYVSPAYEKIWGRPVQELYDTPGLWTETIHPEDRPAVSRAFQSFLAGETDYDMEYRIQRPDGSERWIWARAFRTRHRSGQPDAIAGLAQDITWRKEQQQRIHYMAMHDPLTGLPNRNLFSDRFLQAKALAKRSDSKMALLYLDLDRFKQVNDTYGHKVGDKVLREVARRLGVCLRDTDTVARFGGDEFVLLMSNVQSRKDVETAAYRILAVLSGPIRHSLGTSRLGASIGIAIFPDNGQDQDSLIKAADKMLYKVKQSKGNGFLFAAGR